MCVKADICPLKAISRGVYCSSEGIIVFIRFTHPGKAFASKRFTVDTVTKLLSVNQFYDGYHLLIRWSFKTSFLAQLKLPYYIQVSLRRNSPFAHCLQGCRKSCFGVNQVQFNLLQPFAVFIELLFEVVPN